MSIDLEAIADVVAMAVREANADLSRQLAVAQAEISQIKAANLELSGLRDRVVVAETKIAVLPQPVAAPAVDLSPLTARLDAVERKQYDVSELGKSIGLQIKSLEERPASEDVAGLRDRVLAAETKLSSLDARISEPSPIAPAVERTERAIADLTKDFGLMRERIVAVETRPAVPGPAGERGADGKDGADGLGFDDLSLEQKDERTWAVKAARGERVKDIGTIRIPAQIQRGVWAEGKSYELGDVVTWGGSQWHANESTNAKPGNGTKAWTLVVKCGRDGRDGKDAPGALPVVSVGGGK